MHGARDLQNGVTFGWSNAVAIIAPPKVAFCNKWISNSPCESCPLLGNIVMMSCNEELSWLCLTQDPNALTMLAQLMQPQVLETGHELCCQGNRANRIWILQSGRVQTLRCANVVQALAAPGILGGLAVASDALGCCSVW